MKLSMVTDRTFVGKALRLPLRLLPNETQVRILQGPLRGKKWIAGSNVHGCWLGNFEYAKQRVFAATLQRGQVVYDLGANVGFYSLLASVLVGSEGRVFSFEPVPRNLRLLRRHLELNHVKNCSVFPVAVSCTNGRASFDTGPSPSMGHLTADPQTALTVQKVTLDSLVASEELLPPDVIKCDIEGGEYDALIGARNTVVKYLPTIFLATHGPEVHEQCCKLLSSLKYKMTALDDVPLNESSEILAIPGDSR